MNLTIFRPQNILEIVHFYLYLLLGLGVVKRVS
jgi:hypothetical protein